MSIKESYGKITLQVESSPTYPISTRKPRKKTYFVDNQPSFPVKQQGTRGIRTSLGFHRVWIKQDSSFLKLNFGFSPKDLVYYKIDKSISYEFVPLRNGPKTLSYLDTFVFSRQRGKKILKRGKIKVNMAKQTIELSGYTLLDKKTAQIEQNQSLLLINLSGVSIDSTLQGQLVGIDSKPNKQPDPTDLPF